MSPFPRALAVLVSGGLDSAILLGQAVRAGAVTHPLYVRQGLYWEGAELAHLERFLDALGSPAPRRLQILEMPIADLYGTHWSVMGRGVPGADSPDEAVYLPGRNVLLLAKALLWCHLHGVGAVALAVLAGNPFPDATTAFYDSYQSAVNRAVGGRVQILRPYASKTKTEVLRLGQGLPLEWTLSCLRPDGGQHCGACNKCTERRLAFADAGMSDPTVYRSGRS